MQEGALRPPVEELKTILNLMWRSKKKKKKRHSMLVKSAGNNMCLMKYWRHETNSTQHETLHFLS